MNCYISSKKIIAGLIAFVLAAGCDKKPDDFKSFLNDEELVYPGAIQNASALPGNGRVMLLWRPSPDPSVTKYIVYWNNFADSATVNAASHNPGDTVKTIISGLSEYNYSFYVNSFDAKGNKSIRTSINNARVYGTIYSSALYNRLPDASSPYVVNNDNSVTLKFAAPDTINIGTVIKYTNAAGVASQAVLKPNESTITLPSYKSGEAVTYQSSYIPSVGAIDTFFTKAADTFPPIFKLVTCDKSLFREVKLSGDAGVYESGTSVSKLWDGSVGPQGYPNIYHSNDAQNIPLALSMDMGKLYTNLSILEETGRNCCHNPTDFEVWGIADYNGAEPSKSTQDGGWADEMKAKGWTLLTHAYRSDDGSSATRFNLMDAPPPVRYIRIRINKVASGNGNSANMSELTFWNKQ